MTPTPADVAKARGIVDAYLAHPVKKGAPLPIEHLEARIAQAFAAVRGEERERCMGVVLGLDSWYKHADRPDWREHIAAALRGR